MDFILFFIYVPWFTYNVNVFCEKKKSGEVIIFNPRSDPLSKIDLF